MTAHRKPGRICWEYLIPVVNNPFLWYDIIRAYVLAYALSAILMAVAFILAGEPGGVIRIAPILGLVFLRLAAVSASIAFVWYANRILVRFTLSPDGVWHETLERKDKTVDRGLIVLGLALGRPGASGVGVLAAIREVEFTRWRDIRSVAEHPSPLSVITLKSRWPGYAAALLRPGTLSGDRTLGGKPAVAIDPCQC